MELQNISSLHFFGTNPLQPKIIFNKKDSLIEWCVTVAACAYFVTKLVSALTHFQKSIEFACLLYSMRLNNKQF